MTHLSSGNLKQIQKNKQRELALQTNLNFAKMAAKTQNFQYLFSTFNLIPRLKFLNFFLNFQNSVYFLKGSKFEVGYFISILFIINETVQIDREWNLFVEKRTNKIGLLKFIINVVMKNFNVRNEFLSTV